MSGSSPYSTDTDAESNQSNSIPPTHLLNPHSLLSTSPHNALLLTSISEIEDDTTPTLSARHHSSNSQSLSLHQQRHQPPDLVLDSDDEDDLDQLSIHHNSSHYKQFGDMENEEIVQDGYLEKKGERRKRWQRRWFVLRRTSLVYYKNDKEYRLLRMIPLTDIHTCAEVQVKQHDYTFGIVTPGRTYYVRAKTRAERDAWTAKVTEAKDALKIAASKQQARKHSGDDVLSPSSGTATIIRSNTVIGSGTANSLGKRLPQQVTSLAPNPTATLSTATPLNPLLYSTNPPASILLSTSHSSAISPNSKQTQPVNLAVKPSARPVGAPSNPAIYSPEPSTTSSVISSASDNGQPSSNIGRFKSSSGRGPQGPLLADLMSEEVARDPSQPIHQYPDLSSGGSSNGHDLNYLSSAYSHATNTHGMISSSEEEEDLEEDVLHARDPRSHPTIAEPLSVVGSSALNNTSTLGSLETYSISPPIGERKLTLPDAGKTIIQGYLMKQGKRKAWRKRYFTLTSQKLVYSRSHMIKGGRGAREICVGRILDAIEFDPSPSMSNRHTIQSPSNHHASLPHGFGGEASSSSMQGTSSISQALAKQDQPIEHCFKIITSERTYLVNAPTEEDEIRWISAVRCLLATYRTNHPKNYADILNQPLISPPAQDIPHPTSTPMNSVHKRHQSLSQSTRLLSDEPTTLDAQPAPSK